MAWKENRYQYQKAYVLKHYTPFTVVLNKAKDKELIAHLQAKKEQERIYQRAGEEGYE